MQKLVGPSTLAGRKQSLEPLIGLSDDLDFKPYYDDMKTRQEILDHYRQKPQVSVLIIGAGINGISTFRDLALQGVDALLVDKGDFCSGASAASSHMIHGGIRYLENGEFRLVREAVQERNRLLVNAPHLVKPLPTVIPIFNLFSGLLNAPMKFLGILDKPAERGAIVIKIGLILYDFYTRSQKTVPKHSFFSQKETQGMFSKINPDVKYTARYYDGSMTSPERLCIELLLDGEEANPNSHAVNYLAVDRAASNSVELRDQLNGEVLTVQPKIVINASGPWIDFTNKKMGVMTQFIGGTKGSHLIIDNPELRTAIGENEFFFENKDGRIVLIFPLLDKVMIGTSDLPIDDPDQARCSDEEIKYFIDMVSIIFPDIDINRDQIKFRFSGVRPLPASESKSTGQISRDHSIEIISENSGFTFPIYNLIGGKWTSFRALSEEITDLTLKVLNLNRKISTFDLPIGGGKDFPNDDQCYDYWIENQSIRTGLSPDRIKILFARYGTRAEEFIDFIIRSPDTYLENLSDYSRREIQFITQVEKVVHLDDFLLRRSILAKMGLLSHRLVVEIANIVGRELQWSDERREEEINLTRDLLLEHHSVAI
ncbi:MAG: glycerol-3-phosphate dehydrogenase/oxidase [Chloroflexi bacterium]|nr:glycerol-3-phosphate dehydrogenase/oxidase [Chloroflexota bacterium]